MKRYVSIDVETTGRKPQKHNILEIGAVIDDLYTPIDKLARFHCYVERDYYVGDPQALAMNSNILKRIADKPGGYKYLRPFEVADSFRIFLNNNGYKAEDRIFCAGKNFAGFDDQFLKIDIPRWLDVIRVHRRCLDVGTLYFDPKIHDIPPNMEQCMKIAGLPGEVKHTAVEDALIVVKLIRCYYVDFEELSLSNYKV